MENYYSILGVNRTASASEIKKAYRLSALRWHPDRNQDSSEARLQFLLIQDAYRTLIDPFKRSNHNSILDAQERPAYQAEQSEPHGFNAQPGWHTRFYKNVKQSYVKGFWQFVAINISVLTFLVIMMLHKPQEQMVMGMQNKAAQEADFVQHYNTMKAAEEIALTRKAVADEMAAVVASAQNLAPVSLTSQIYKDTYGREFDAKIKELDVLEANFRASAK